MTSVLYVVAFDEMMLLLVAERPGPMGDAELFHKRTAGAEINVAIAPARMGLEIGWVRPPTCQELQKAVL